MRQLLATIAGTLIVGTATACGGGTTGDPGSHTRLAPTNHPNVNERHRDWPQLDCPKQLVVSHVPGHTEKVWMLECSTTPYVRPQPSTEG
jgi:hypothetical protein